jgi:hypothetical protein
MLAGTGLCGPDGSVEVAVLNQLPQFSDGQATHQQATAFDE